MGKTPPLTRFGLMVSTAWLAAGLSVVFKGSDPEDVTFRMEAANYGVDLGQYQGCGECPAPKLDVPETINFYYLDTMKSIHGLIADWRGEPPLDFEWVRRQIAKRRTSARLERKVAGDLRRRMSQSR